MAGLALIAHATNILYFSGDVLGGPNQVFSSPAPDEREREVARFILTAVQNAEGEVLSEYPIFTILSGREVLLQPFIMSRLAIEGRWDQSKFVQDLQRRRFSIIVTLEDMGKARRGEPLMRYTPEMAHAILDHYAPLGSGPLHSGALGTRYYFYFPNANGTAEERDQRLVDRPFSNEAPRGVALN